MRGAAAGAGGGREAEGRRLRGHHGPQRVDGPLRLLGHVAAPQASSSIHRNRTHHGQDRTGQPHIGRT